MRLYSAFKRITTSVACFSALVLCVGIAHAQQDSQLIGKWKMVSTTPDGNDVPWNLSITYKDGNYSALLGSDQGESAPKDFKVEGSKVHLVVPYEGEEYEIDLKLLEGKLAGTWSGNNTSGQTKGEKTAG